MRWLQHWIRLIALTLLSTVALQLFFLSRIALMSVSSPQSTSLQRSEAWRLIKQEKPIHWQQSWVDYADMAHHLKRAVIASEDAGFAEHSGVDWDALEKAWEKNQKAQEQADRINEQITRANQAFQNFSKPLKLTKPTVQAKVIGGSTISQQLAKNLFLGTERNLARKGQEFIITMMLEGFLSKQRLFEIYLNHIEWGEGIFGAQAAAYAYHRVSVDQLNSYQAAQLAVMLPAPKRFEKKRESPYLRSRAAVIRARMGSVELP
ncbi:MAG: transglycosylase domain-containing protein [Burkholderiales bacterium]